MVAMVVGAALGMAALAATYGIRKAREQRAEHERVLVQGGFRACEAELGELTAVVRSVHGSDHLEVRKPWKRAGADAPIYWYEVGTGPRHEGQRVAADEFLCTLKRTSDAPFALFLLPVKLGKGIGAKLIEGVLSMAAPTGLQKLAVPQRLQEGGVFAAFGPAGAVLTDLLDEVTLGELAQGAHHGIHAILGRGDRCALELNGDYASRVTGKVGWQDSWAFVQRVAG